MSTVKLTPLQLRETVGLTQETLRYWRRELTPLHGRRGASPLYTPGEALALRVVRELVDTGFKIQAIRSMADAMFDICRGGNWGALEGCCMVLRPTLGTVTLEHYPLRIEADRSSIFVVPLASHIDAVRLRLLDTDSHPQGELRFPPLGLTRRTAAESGRR